MTMGFTKTKVWQRVSALCVLLLCAYVAACDADSDVFVPSKTGASTTSAGGSAPTSSGQGGSKGEGGSTFSTGSGEGGAGGQAAKGCDKVDFLFIIDNSVSMQDQQAALIASFPNFISTIQSTIKADSDYHIMVVDSDAQTRCTPSNCKSGAMSAGNLCKNTPDGGYACKATFEPCDSTLGAGVIHPAGKGASNKLCALEGGNRYIVESEADKSAAFSCVAQVGLAGHPAERPMDAMVAALSPEINGPDGCNTGFLRKDAILVITFISDDPNKEDSGTPQDWYDAVVAAKGGDASSVAVLGFRPGFPGCGGGGKHWSEFVQLWGERGIEVSVCEKDYGPPFQDAVKIIDETCDDFTPPS